MAQGAPKHRQGCGGQGVLALFVGSESSSCGWTIWGRVALLSIRMPLVLLFPEGDHCDLSREGRIPISVVVVKHNPHRMGMIAILVNQKKRPLAIRTVQSIGGHQNVSL